MSEIDAAMPRTKKSVEHTGFKTIETIGRLVLHVILRFWRACSAAMLTLLLLYWLYGGVVSFLLLMAAVFGALYHYQDTLLYFPDQPVTSRVFVQNPAVLGFPFENLYIKTQDGVSINAIFIKQSPQFQSSVPTVLFFHGNAGNVGHRLTNARSWHSYCGCNVFLVEYRGYGKSEGSPSEQGKEGKIVIFPLLSVLPTSTLCSLTSWIQPTPQLLMRQSASIITRQSKIYESLLGSKGSNRKLTHDYLHLSQEHIRSH